MIKPIHEYVNTLISAKRYDIMNENSEYKINKRYINTTIKNTIKEIQTNPENFITPTDKQTIERVKKEYNIDLEKELLYEIKYNIQKEFHKNNYYIHIQYMTGTDTKSSNMKITKYITKVLNKYNPDSNIKYEMYHFDCIWIIFE